MFVLFDILHPNLINAGNARQGPNIVKLFTLVIYQYSKYVIVFVIATHFQPNLMSVSKAGAYYVLN